LRALVLHLDKAVLERGGAGERRAVLEAQAERRPWGRFGLDMLAGKRAARRLAIGLQRIDPQIDRGACVERRHLVFEMPAVKRREMWFEPLRHIVSDGARHLRMGEAAAGQSAREAQLERRQRRRTKAVAIEIRRDV